MGFAGGSGDREVVKDLVADDEVGRTIFKRKLFGGADDEFGGFGVILFGVLFGDF